MRLPLDKLQSESGVSILYGLLFLLVALMVTGYIISASITAVERLHDDQQTEQNMLTLRSAANLVRDELEDTTFVVEITVNHDQGDAQAPMLESAEGPYYKLLESAVGAAAGIAAANGSVAVAPADYSGSFDVKVGETDAAGALGGSTVHVTYKMARNILWDDTNSYLIDATFSLIDEQGRAYNLFMQAPWSPYSCDPPEAYKSTGAETVTQTIKWTGNTKISTDKEAA